MDERLLLMAKLQDRYNSEVNPAWRDAGYEYYRAIWVECAELLDHFGWKWWKHQSPDLDQVRLEVVDIWHFGLSILLREDRLAEAQALLEVAPAGDLRQAVEQLAQQTLNTHSFDVDGFVGLMGALDMDFDALHKGYIGKNVLNQFRLSHGYRDGSYEKIWHGREDNEHLAELMNSSPVSSEEQMAALFASLETRYPA